MQFFSGARFCYRYYRIFECALDSSCTQYTCRIGGYGDHVYTYYFRRHALLYGYNYIMTVMRGAGDSKTPFYFLIVSVVLDVLLNPLLIFGWGSIPAMGIGGSATATLIAQGISFVLILIYLYRVKYFCALLLQSFIYSDLIGRLFGP